MNKISLFKIGLACGLIPLVIELIIFFTWWIARAYFVYDISCFAIFRTVIVILYIPIAMIGIIIFIIFLVKNFRNNKTKTQTLTGILIILMNFPILFILRAAEMQIGPRAYLKIYNFSGSDFSELIIKEPDQQKFLGNLNQNKTIIGFYYPDYKRYENSNSSSEFSGISGNILIVRDKKGNYELPIPIIHPGEIVKLKIDKEFRLSKF